LIAAQARRRGAVLVTANRREFDRVPGLMVTDWNDQ
jgi:tRNA(fMet)-specific endonuclease VapC